MKDDSPDAGQLKGKKKYKKHNLFLKFFKNLTFVCSLGKFLIIENFSFLLIKNSSLDG
jgi:hypothetical protein